MDYATSNDGLLSYTNKHSFRPLTDAGNFYMSSEIMSYGLSLVDESKMPFDETTNKKESSDVLSFTNSNYEVNNTYDLPFISTMKIIDSSVSDAQYKQNYINQIKNGVKNYGGVVAETLAPGGQCSFANNGKYVIAQQESCYDAEDGHAMQIIGWDDNYSYSYCSGTQLRSVVNNSCTSGTKVTGTGAFLVRNSWGENSAAKYVYLTYDSITSDAYSPTFHYITDMTSTSNKKWDNVYPRTMEHGVNIPIVSSAQQSFTKEISTPEKLQQVKFNTFSINSTFSIEITVGSDTYTYNNIINTAYPGIYTIDLSDKNIIINNDTFNVKITGPYILKDTIAAYTSNLSSDPIINIKNFDGYTVNSPTEVTQRIYAKTKNISSGTPIAITLKDRDNVDKSSLITIKENTNKVAENDMNAEVVFSNSIPPGEYVLSTSYGTTNVNKNIKIGVDVEYHSNDDQNSITVDSHNKSEQFTLKGDIYNKTGYYLKEWNTSANGSGDIYQKNQIILDGLTQDLNLYAQYEEIIYSIKFDPNTGTGSMADLGMEYNETKRLPKNTFTKEDKVFISWNTKADGTGTSYSDEQEICNLTTEYGTIITLYAIWGEDIEYEIHNYSVDESNNYISKIPTETEVNTFKNNIVLGPGFTVEVDSKTVNDKQYLYTGGKTKIKKGTTVFKEYTNIVVGDVNGDALINSGDLLKIRQHLLGLSTLTSYYYVSGDVNYDNSINSGDLLRVRQHLLGTKPIV